MKKRLLLLAVAAGIISVDVHAQLALENFNAGVLPAGWVEISDGHTVSTSFASGAPSIATRLDDSAWINYPLTSATDLGMLTTSFFSPAATADRWLITPAFTVTSANMVIQWDDNDLGSGETIEVLASPTAGTTAAAFTTTLYNNPATPGGVFGTHQSVIGAYVGTSIRIAFRDNTHDNWGLGIDNVTTAILPHSVDLGVTSANLNPFIQTGTSHTISGIIHNYGGTTVTSMNIEYSVNGVTATPATALTSISFPGVTDYSFSSTNPWTPSTAGTYTVKVWADNINGGTADENNANDTFTTTVVVLDSLQPKIVLIEEFNQASCDPCAAATPNLDSVYANNASRSMMVRYHVNFPGRDCMDSVTLDAFVQDQLTFYNVTGVPDAQVDGSYVYPGAAGPGTMSTAVLGAAASLGSPFKIVVTPSFNATTQTYSFSAAVTSYTALPAGLTLRAALTVDQLTYAANQSTESIPQFDFPEVAENMFPNAGGQPLAAFTAGSTQTLTGSWVKDHPWASNASVWKYDSTLTGRIVAWVQNDATGYVYQVGYAPVSTVFTTGIATVSNNASMDVYPNPATKTATVALSLKANTNITMEVLNTLGQVVYTMPAQNRNSGISMSTIDVSNFAAGQYFVKISAGTEVMTKQLTVIK